MIMKNVSEINILRKKYNACYCICKIRTSLGRGDENLNNHEIEKLICSLKKYDDYNYYTKLNNIAIYYYYARYREKEDYCHDYYYLEACRLLKEISKSENIFEISLGISCGYVQLAYMARCLNNNGQFNDLIKKLEYLIDFYSFKIINEYTWKNEDRKSVV